MGRNDVRIIVDLFKLYYKSTNKISDYKFVVDDKTEKRIRDFCSWVRDLTDSDLQMDYLKSYFEFQFNRHYKKRGVRGGRGLGSGIKLSWIICKKSFDEWVKIDNKPKAAYKVRKNFKKDVEIIHKEKKLDWSRLYSNVNPSEEIEKNILFGHENHLDYCLEFTFLYHRDSPTCFSCPNKKECQIIQKNKFPQIHKFRGDF